MQANIRRAQYRDGPKRSADEFKHMRGKVFDFDAWYRAHYYDEIGSPIQQNWKVKNYSIRSDRNESDQSSFEVKPLKRINKGPEYSQAHSQQQRGASIEKTFTFTIILAMIITFSLKICDNYLDYRDRKKREKTQNKTE